MGTASDGPTVHHSSQDRRSRRALPLVGSLAPVEAVSPRSARISFTDRCDLACTYCRPARRNDGRRSRLPVSAWKTLLRGLAEAGVRRIRITGGEPLLHPDLVELVEYLASLGLEDLALTTNGSQLARLAEPLRRAGLHRVNVSVDTLDPERFRTLTRGGELGAVLAGIDAALAAGLTPVKLNTVVLRSQNLDEVEPIVEWAWARKMVPRFLELMPIGEGARLAPTDLVTVAEIRARLAACLAAGKASAEHGRGPARYIASRSDPRLRVGFISGSSDTFCAGCDRLRVSASGALRACLARADAVDAASAAGAGDLGAVVEAVATAWANKPDGELWRGCTEPGAAGLSMRVIGG